MITSHTLTKYLLCPPKHFGTLKSYITSQCIQKFASQWISVGFVMDITSIHIDMSFCPIVENGSASVLCTLYISLFTPREGDIISGLAYLVHEKGIFIKSIGAMDCYIIDVPADVLSSFSKNTPLTLSGRIIKCQTQNSTWRCFASYEKKNDPM